MEKLKNPFLLTGFYGKEYFCDRVSELNELKDHFNNERNVVLFSWRRIGKTALLKCFLKDIKEEGGVETLYVDLLGTRDTSTALRKLTQSIYEIYGNISTGISASFRNLLGKTGIELGFDPITGVPKFIIRANESGNVVKSLEAIGEFLSNRKKRLIIVLDEFQQVTSYPEGDGEALFRSWAQSYPGIRFIFSGSHRNMMPSMFTEKNRPFYRSAQLMQLDPIEFNAYQDFVRHHFESNKKSFNDNAFEEIYSWTRKQTYYIQLICNKVFGSYEGMNHEILDEVFKQIIDQESPFFSGYTRLLTNMQWRVLWAVAKEEPLASPLASDFLGRNRLGAASSVSTALKMLEKNEMIIVDGDVYYIHDVLLSRWLQTL